VELHKNVVIFAENLQQFTRIYSNHKMNRYLLSAASKAELLQEGIFFLIHLFVRDVLVMKKLEIEKTKPTLNISVLKVDYYIGGLSFFDFQLFF
jgi:hypothetical protein